MGSGVEEADWSGHLGPEALSSWGFLCLMYGRPGPEETGYLETLDVQAKEQKGAAWQDRKCLDKHRSTPAIHKKTSSKKQCDLSPTPASKGTVGSSGL